MTNRQIPMDLEIVGSGVAGNVYELFPRLLEFYTDEELDKIGVNAMSCIGDHYLVPTCGSALWVVYKRVAEKNLEKFAEALGPENAKQTRELIKKEMWGSER